MARLSDARCVARAPGIRGSAVGGTSDRAANQLCEPGMKRPKINEGPCIVNGCDTKAYAKRMCKRHYNRVWRRGDAHAGEWWKRLQANILKTSTCWLWTGLKQRNGYGVLKRKQRDLYT